MTTFNCEYDCTKKCRNIDHGEKIISALTKRSIEDAILAAYIAKLCQNFVNVQDFLGRTGLHMCSSVNRYAICEWFLNHGAMINTKDYESGSSPLHRALFYGCIDCAVLLIKYGASFDIMDNDTYKPVQNICRMTDLPIDVESYNELLVWGSNKNYNLGIGNNDIAKVPQSIDLFRKDNISISKVSIGQYHSLFLDRKGNLYAVGSGRKGRLGINTENSLAVPKRVNKLNIKNAQEKIIDISVSCYHSMVLTNRGMVHVCGSNEHKQLGFKPPPEMLLTFREVPAFNQRNIDEIKGIKAHDFYSVAYSKSEIYVWGKNSGQFGMGDTVDEILLPKLIPIPEAKRIEYVTSSDYALAIATSGKHILLYYNYKIKIIKPPVLEGVKSLAIIAPDPNHDKNQNKDKSQSVLKLLLLTDTNAIYIWSDDIQQYYRCSFMNYRLAKIDKIFFKHNQVFLMSEGDVYLGKCSKIPISSAAKESESAWVSSTQIKKEINDQHKIRIQLERIDIVDRAVDISCDENLESYAVLQEHSRKYFVVPKMFAEEYNFKKLLNDVNEFDTIHDVVLHVDGENFYAHKFIIYSRAKGLKAIIEQTKTKNVNLNYENFTAKMFELILKYIYCNYFLVAEDITDILYSLGHNFNQKLNPLDIFLNVAEKFALNDLVTYVRSHFQENDIKASIKHDKNKFRFNRVKRNNYPDLCDVNIKCENDKILKAHKCVLVTRLEYFNMMFTHSWSETSTIKLTTVPIEYMEPIIDFLYSADIENFKKQNYNETFLYNMIVICDQFFINRLKKVCEILVLDKISIRKSGEMLEFAESYNCEILKHGCMDFISQNLSRVLYQRGLEVCEPETLKHLNNHYRKIFQNIFDYRIITPYNECIDDEEMIRFVADFNVDLSYKIDQNSTPIKGVKKIKIKEEKYKIDKRNYEKDAISTKLQELSIAQITETTKNDTVKKSLPLDKQNEAANITKNQWNKVNEKSEHKNKSVPGNINSNKILREEGRQKENFVTLNKTPKTSSFSDNSSIQLNDSNCLRNDKSENENSFGLSCRQSLNFGDFTPLRSEKISQKQKKRLSSESSKTTDSPLDHKNAPSTPIAIPVVKPNAWGIVTPPPSASEIDLTHSFSSSIKSTPDKTNHSFTDYRIQKSPAEAVSNKNSLMSNSAQLTQIVENERRQKEYFEKLRTKSLALTQIEERAISELEEFYNVENCEDEIITIHRKPTRFNFDCPTWQKN